MTDKILFSSVFAFASGIALYFVLPFEPVVLYPILISALLFGCFLRYKNPLFLLVLGFFYTIARTDMVETKLIRHNIHNAEISGVVKDIDYTAYKDRVLVLTDSGLFRISVNDSVNCKIGQNVKLRANLYAPSAPDAFNKFDFARWSFFNGLSGTGTAISGACSKGADFALREFIHNKAQSKLVDSLILGYKNAIPKSDMDKARAAGIAHIFSISGFHLALLGGWIFFIFSCIVKMFPKFVRRFPSRNLALPMTGAGLLFYLVLSGADTATIRAFVMTAVAMIAAILDRQILTIRNAALVFLVMIIFNPSWLVSAGFQLSFASVFGLLSFFKSHPMNKKGRFAKFICAIVLSSAIAGVWTLPFIAYHFGNVSVYGIFGNLLALPIFSFAIMPLVMVGTILALFGSGFALDAANYLFDFVMRLCDGIKSLPAAVIEMPDIHPIVVFAIFTAMFMFLTGKRKQSFIAVLATFIYVVFTPIAVLRTTSDGEIVGFTNNGKTYFNAKYSEKHPFIIPRQDFLRADCSKGLCEYKTDNWSAVSVQRFMPILKNADKLCDYDFIVSYLPLELPKCQEKIVVGSVKIYKNGDMENVNILRQWH